MLPEEEWKARHEELQRQAKEREEQRKLALRLIRIGYKALIADPPPNQYGYRWTMAALKRARKRLKASLPAATKQGSNP